MTKLQNLGLLCIISIISVIFGFIKATKSLKEIKEHEELAADAFAEFLVDDTGFNNVTGFFGFLALKENEICRFSGSFDTGLVSSNTGDYQLKVDHNRTATEDDLTAKFRESVKIDREAHSTAYFRLDFTKNELNCSQAVAKVIVLYIEGKVLGSAKIQTVV